MDQFLTLFELYLLALLSDSRFLRYRPSVIAAVVTCRSIEKMRCEGIQIDCYRNALRDSLKWSEAGGMFEECYELVGNVPEINLLVAMLIARVTFAAAFTMPGGYHSDGPDEGMASLTSDLAF
ncbi:hypothetical protein NL676_007729 [Syzygium grande]|nr:hypothetical protein NL676_007729 [Syzygium grande]